MPLAVERIRNDCHPLEKRFYRKIVLAATPCYAGAAANPTHEPTSTTASGLEF